MKHMYYFGWFRKDPVTGHKKRPQKILEQMDRRFTTILNAVKAAEANGAPMRHHYYTPGLARWAMKLERGLCHDHG